jgi:hypothetical protein
VFGSRVLIGGIQVTRDLCEWIDAVIKMAQRSHFIPLPSYQVKIQHSSKADTLKATEANRRRGPGTREKVKS